MDFNYKFQDLRRFLEDVSFIMQTGGAAKAVGNGQPVDKAGMIINIFKLISYIAGIFVLIYILYIILFKGYPRLFVNLFTLSFRRQMKDQEIFTENNYQFFRMLRRLSTYYKESNIAFKIFDIQYNIPYAGFDNATRSSRMGIGAFSDSLNSLIMNSFDKLQFLNLNQTYNTPDERYLFAFDNYFRFYDVLYVDEVLDSMHNVYTPMTRIIQDLKYNITLDNTALANAVYGMNNANNPRGDILKPEEIQAYLSKVFNYMQYGRIGRCNVSMEYWKKIKEEEKTVSQWKVFYVKNSIFYNKLATYLDDNGAYSGTLTDDEKIANIILNEIRLVSAGGHSMYSSRKIFFEYIRRITRNIKMAYNAIEDNPYYKYFILPNNAINKKKIIEDIQKHQIRILDKTIYNTDYVLIDGIFYYSSGQPVPPGIVNRATYNGIMANDLISYAWLIAEIILYTRTRKEPYDKAKVLNLSDSDKAMLTGYLNMTDSQRTTYFKRIVLRNNKHHLIGIINDVMKFPIYTSILIAEGNPTIYPMVIKLYYTSMTGNENIEALDPSRISSYLDRINFNGIQYKNLIESILICKLYLDDYLIDLSDIMNKRNVNGKDFFRNLIEPVMKDYIKNGLVRHFKSIANKKYWKYDVEVKFLNLWERLGKKLDALYAKIKGDNETSTHVDDTKEAETDFEKAKKEVDSQISTTAEKSNDTFSSVDKSAQEKAEEQQANQPQQPILNPEDEAKLKAIEDEKAATRKEMEAAKQESNAIGEEAKKERERIEKEKQEKEQERAKLPT